MNKKYVYEFVNETVEIEISEEWESFLRDKDRTEYNSNKKETRRHLKLDTAREDGEWIIDSDCVPELIVMNEDTVDRFIEKAKNMLTEKQLEALIKICIEGYSVSEYARLIKTNKSVVCRRLQSAKARLYKKYENNKNFF